MTRKELKKVIKIIENSKVIHENGSFWDESTLNKNTRKMYQDIGALVNNNEFISNVSETPSRMD